MSLVFSTSRNFAHDVRILATRRGHDGPTTRTCTVLAGRRLLSSESSPAATETASSSTSSTHTTCTAEASLGTVARHGKGDACVTLNVGGKEFHTLRSTVDSNPVLAAHVARAEANQGATLKNGAVFIDRDPEHFGFILKHLRNHMEESTVRDMHMTSLPALTKTYANKPDEGGKVLRELFVEASYYKIPELQKASSQLGFLSKILYAFNHNMNPIDSAAKLAARINATLITIGSLGTAGTAIFVAVKTDLEWAFDKIGLKEQWQWLLKKLGVEKAAKDGTEEEKAVVPEP